MTKVRHILGISGGKDSAALSIYLKQKYPQLKIEYYNSDTGCELAETEVLIDRLSAYLGSIKRLRAAEGSPEPTPFEHFLKAMGGFLPSPQQRWCTKKMKLAEFERYAGEDYAVSYVGIRGDEDRDGFPGRCHPPAVLRQGRRCLHYLRQDGRSFLPRDLRLLPLPR